MATCSEMLESAISLAKQELDCLKQADLDRVEELCNRRSELMAQAHELVDAGKDHFSQGRLERLQEIQEEMVGEASRLQSKIKQQILSGNKQKNGFRGYGKANAYTPKIQSRFISKRG